MKTSPCRACGEPMLWITMPSGNKNPLDPEPTSAGTVILEGDPGDREPKGRHLRRGEQYDGPRYTSHFTTCPWSARFRKRR